MIQLIFPKYIWYGHLQMAWYYIFVHSVYLSQIYARYNEINCISLFIHINSAFSFKIGKKNLTEETDF